MDVLVRDLNRQVLRFANTLACTAVYKGWTPEFCKSEAVDLWDKVKNRYTVKDFQSVDLDTLLGYGFAIWSSYDANGKKVDEEDTATQVLLLFPLYAYPLLEYNETLVSILGNRREKTETDCQIDLDTRGGAIAYGFFHPIGRNILNKALPNRSNLPLQPAD